MNLSDYLESDLPDEIVDNLLQEVSTLSDKDLIDFLEDIIYAGRDDLLLEVKIHHYYGSNKRGRKKQSSIMTNYLFEDEDAVEDLYDAINEYEDKGGHKETAGHMRYILDTDVDDLLDEE